jgi:hypothetical protein
MSWSTRNSGKPVTPQVVSQVKALAGQNTPTPVIGFKTGRTPGAVYKIASDHGITLKPTNQSPYGRR